MQAEVEKFYAESGFKILAMAKLSQAEYSVFLYLLNCAVSGMEHVVTNESELASLMGYSDDELHEALKHLQERNMVKVHYGDKHHHRQEPHSIRIGINFSVTSWYLDLERELSHKDAIVYPFRRQGSNNLQILNGERKSSSHIDKNRGATWGRVVGAFAHGRDLDADERAKAEESAKVLVDTHPVDQVLLMLRHFGQRIPTLSLLASSWQHYQELFESETQKVDLLGARQKHLQLDQSLRDEVRSFLEKRSDLNLADEEVEVLKILLKHRHPRRQLFWAYQTRSRYPHLSGFFEKNAPIMLPVTSGGAIVKKNVPLPSE